MIKLRITKLHLMMLGMIMFGISYWGYAYYQQSKADQETAEKLRIKARLFAKAPDKAKTRQFAKAPDKAKAQQFAKVPEKVEFQQFAKVPEKVETQQFAKATGEGYEEQSGGANLREDASDAIVVAENMLERAYADGKDISLPELTINQARNSLNSGEYKQASSLARQAIEEIKQASVSVQPAPSQLSGSVTYTVKRGDTLWGISKKAEHYGLGSKWVGIWRKNEGKIPDFDLILPGQKIVIPVD